MSIWYKVSRYGMPTIELVEVKSSSTAYVNLINGSRAKQSGQYESYFPSWKQAHEWLMAISQQDIDRARMTLERLKGRHGNIVGMKEPQP